MYFGGIALPLEVTWRIFLYGACACHVIPSRNKNPFMKTMKSGKVYCQSNAGAIGLYFVRDSVALQSVFNAVKNRTDGCL